jgi:hypothetical protein
MFRNFKVANFRCFDELRLTGLRQINLFTGKNNVGKTALLESLWIHSGYHNPSVGFRTDVFRGLDRFRRDEFQWDLFKDFDPTKVITTESVDENRRIQWLKISMRPAGPQLLPASSGAREEQSVSSSTGRDVGTGKPGRLGPTEIVYKSHGFDQGPEREATATLDGEQVKVNGLSTGGAMVGIFLSARHGEAQEVADRLGNVIRRKEVDRVIRILSILDNRLTDLAVLPLGGVPVVHCDLGFSDYVPIQLAGDGMMRLLRVVVAIADAQGGIVCVDEIENGIHHSVMVDVWRAVGQMARDLRVQVFATTHSLECMASAHRGLDTSTHALSVYRLQRVESKIVVVHYDDETLADALTADMEIR